MSKRYKLEGPEELAEVERAWKKARDMRDRQRLKAIRLGMMGNSTMEEVAGKVGVSRATIGTWSKNFRAGGMAAVLLTAFEERGRKSEVNAEVQEQIRGKLATGDFKRAKELQAWLSEHHGIELGLKAVYYWLGKVGGVLKVPRKTHARKDAVAAAAFKVELADRLGRLGVPQGAKVRIWVADEHRYGLISVLRKVWTLRGHKPVAPYQTKYQWGHLYAALEVGGENSCEFFFSPTVSLEVSDFFLRQVAESDEEAHHVVIWDGAGFHPKTGSHPIPERIHLLQLPAYSPELNPVEKLFDQLKDEIGNRLFDSLDDIEAAITTLLATFWSELRNVVSLIGNGWLLDQSNTSANPYRPVIN
jgi:transposase